MSSIYSLPEKAFRIQLKISMAMNRISKHSGGEDSNGLWVAPENRDRFEQLRNRRKKILDKYYPGSPQ